MLQHRGQRGFQLGPAGVVLLRAGRDERDVAHPAGAVEIELHAEAGQDEAVAGPTAVRIEPLDQIGQRRPQFVDRNVVDDQPRPQRQQDHNEPQRVEHQEHDPDVLEAVGAEVRGGHLGEHQGHGSDDDESGDGQAQDGRVAGAGDQERPPRQVDHAQQEHVDGQRPQGEALMKRFHGQSPIPNP